MEASEFIRFVRHENDDAINDSEIAYKIRDVAKTGTDIRIKPKCSLTARHVLHILGFLR
jgi:hypothetical protein